jgi:Flp pilus assembly protein TadG
MSIAARPAIIETTERFMAAILSAIRKDCKGNAVIELALVAPLLLLILLGIVGYGGYFYMAHGLQETANDAARSAIAGLTSDERRTLAQNTVTTELARFGGIDPTATATVVQDDGTNLSVAIAYDASRNAIMRLSLVPLPSRMIRRQATILLGGV